MIREIFLDNNATTQPLPEVTAAVMAAMSESFGNASSNNRAGERARRLLRESRESVASLIGAASDSIHFTSGATESNNWVLQRVCGKPGTSLVATVAEHSSIINLFDFLDANGTQILRLPIDQYGLIDCDQFAATINRDTTLVSVHWVNNETGIVQPIEKIAAICRERGVLFHTDASQAVGKMQVDVEKVGCDFLSFSGHKFHGPQGVGGLYIRPGVKLTSLLFGGNQEHARRAGTENLPGIAGMGAAAAERFSKMDGSIDRLRQSRDRFESAVISRIPNVVINGDVEHRICNTTNLRFEGINGEALVARLDQQGIRCSQSSACTNQRPEPSYVLRAMGLSESQAYASIRSSVTVGNTIAEIDESVEILADLVPNLLVKVCFASDRNVRRMVKWHASNGLMNGNRRLFGLAWLRKMLRSSISRFAKLSQIIRQCTGRPHLLKCRVYGFATYRMLRSWIKSCDEWRQNNGRSRHPDTYVKTV